MTHRSPLRAVIYTRLSSHRGDADLSTSPARQIATCRAYAEAKGWTVAAHIGEEGVIADLDVSGSDKDLRLNRPGLVKLREHFGEYDVIVCAKLDRIARNVIDFRAFAEEAAEHGAALVSVAELLDLTTPDGKFVATILAAFAEMEAATIADRTLAGIAAARKLGRWVGNAPFGYRLAPVPGVERAKTLAPDPESADIVRELARRALDGEPLYSLAMDLNRRGILTSAGRAVASGTSKRTEAPAGWSATTLRRLLINPAMIGRTVHRGELIRGEDGLPVQQHEPILQEDDWRGLVALLTPTGDARPRPIKGPGRMLSDGVARCATCGGKLYVTSRTRPDGSTRPFYVCSAKRNGLDCTGAAIDSAGLEALVSGEFLARYGAVPYVEMERIAVDDGRRADLEATLSDLAARMTERGADRRALVGQMDTIEAQIDALPATSRMEWRSTPSGETYAERWAASDAGWHRKLLTDAGVSVRVGPGIRGRKGFDPRRCRIDGLDTLANVVLSAVDDAAELAAEWAKRTDYPASRAVDTTDPANARQHG